MQARDPLRRAWLALGLLTAIGAVAVVVAVVRLPEGDAGWGPNGRAWGDDEFWMDVLVHAVPLLLVAAAVGLGAVALHRQRAAEIAAREQQVSDERAARAREERRDVVAGVGDQLADLGYEAWQLCGALRLQAEHDAAGAPDDVSAAVIRARYDSARDAYARSLAWLQRVPFRTEDPGFVEGPFGDAYRVLEDFLVRAERAWATRPVTVDAASAVQAAGAHVSETVARTSRAVTHWLADGTVPAGGNPT